MKFVEQKIKGVFLIEAEPFVDFRGVFRRNFCQNEFKTRGINPRIVQCNIIENPKKATLRGFHYQPHPYAETKTFTCFKGSFYFSVVDLRPKSKTYLKWQGFKLDENTRITLSVPAGCANGSLSLKNNSLIHYYISNFYKPGVEKGIRYNDPLFKFKWPIKPAIISEKDLGHPDFKLSKWKK